MLRDSANSVKLIIQRDLPIFKRYHGTTDNADREYLLSNFHTLETMSLNIQTKPLSSNRYLI